MFSRFFIERPIFANVIAIMTMLVGAVTLGRAADRAVSRASRRRRSWSRRPTPAPTPRCSPTPWPRLIEQEVNGVEGMLYMSSTCSSDGSYKLTVTFEVGTDLDKAQVLVQNRLADRAAEAPAGGPAAGDHGQEAVDQHHHGRRA